MQRIKLTTEWVEWQKDANGAHILSGALDYVAVISEELDEFTLDVFPDAYYARHINAWAYADERDTATHYYRSLDEAKAACLRMLEEYGLLDPLDLLLESVCESS